MWTDIKDSSPTTKSFTAKGLTNFVKHSFQIRAVNSIGPGPASPTRTGVPIVPLPAPTSLTATPGNTEVDLSWTMPSGAWDSYVFTYEYQMKEVPTGNWGDWTRRSRGLLKDLSTTHTVTGLNNGTAYHFKVRAMNLSNPGQASSEASATPTAQVPAKPEAPALTIGNKQLGVAWTAPANNGAPINDYDVRYKESSDTAWTNRTHSGTTTSTTITGLTNGQSYQVQVRAINTAGTGDWSPSTSATPAAQVPTAPSAPALTPDDHKIGVTWTAPADNGASISDYDVQYKESGVTAWTDHTHTGAGTSTTITGKSRTQPYGLYNGTNYDVQVRARNSVGWSGWSPSTSAKPEPRPVKPFGFGTTDGGDGFVTSIWAEPNPRDMSIIKYQYRQKAGAGNWGLWTDIKDSSPTTKSFTAKGLTNFVKHSFQIRAVNSIGPGPASPTRTGVPIVPLPAPTSLTATPGNTEVDLSWTMPSGAWDSYVFTYEYQMKEVPTGNWGDWTRRSRGLLKDLSTTHTVTGLNNGTAYHFKVRAMNLSNPGQASSEASATPTAQVPAKPEAPALTPGNKQLGVAWTAPANNGAPISDYDVRYKESSANVWINRGHNSTTTSTVITGLTNGQSYLVKVRAKNSVGDGDWSPSTTGTPAAAPAKPAAPVLTIGNQQLGVTWTAPADNGAAISDYDVQYKLSSAANNDPWTDASYTGTGPSTTITGLTNGQSYQVQVRAINTAGNSLWSDAASAIPTAQVPAKPAAPVLTIGNQQLGVTWTAPADNGAAISDYDVQYKLSSAANNDPWTDASYTGTGPSTTITGLTNGQSYQVQVRAINTAGNSLWSDAASAIPTAQVPAKPAAPVLTIGNKQLGVTWTAPADNGAAISDYDVQYKLSSAANNDPWTDASYDGTGPSTTITGLTNGQSYQVQVRAINTAGNSLWSDAASAIPTAQVPAKPAAPVLTIGNQQLGVTWTAPADNGAAISDYDVQYKLSSAANNDPWTDASYDGTGPSTTITGLTNGQSYQVQVRAKNSVGDGDWSPSATGTPAAAPAKPAAPVLTIGNQQLGVTWTAPADNGAAISDYDVQYKLSSAANNDPWTDASYDGTGPSTTITGLTNGQSYQVQVRAINTAGNSLWSDAASAIPTAQVPAKPAAPVLTIGNQQLGVAWTAPADNGAAISDYDVQYKLSSAANNDPWTDASYDGTGPSTTITGLTNGQSYQVQVRAINTAGNSLWSDAASAIPTAQVPAKPAAPALTIGNQQLGVTWTAPADNGAAISDYDVQYKLSSAANNDPWTDASYTGTGPSTTITGLTNGQSYQVQVRAINTAGNSLWSDAASAIPTAQVPAKPAAPVLTIGNQQLGVTWTAPADNGAAISDYDVQYKLSSAANNDPWTDASYTGTGPSTTITGLTNGQSYQVRRSAQVPAIAPPGTACGCAIPTAGAGRCRCSAGRQRRGDQRL